MNGWNKSSKSSQALSHSSSSSTGCGCFGIFFFGIFFAVGSITSYIFLINPLSQYLAVQQWQATPCTIVESTWTPLVNEYQIEVLYEYTFQGEQFECSQFRYPGHSESNFVSDPSWEQILQPGSETTCYVDPEAPTQAVLNRDFSFEILIGIVPLLFAFIGLTGMVMAPILAYRIRQSRKKGNTLESSFPHRRNVWTENFAGDEAGRPQLQNTSSWNRLKVALGEEELTPTGQQGHWQFLASSGRGWLPPFTPGPQEIKTAQSRWTIFLGLLIFSLVWNGIISIPLSEFLSQGQLDNGAWIFLLFLIPFAAIGLGLFVTSIYYLLSMFNPTAQLYVSDGAVPLGQSLKIKWVLTGKIAAIREFHVHLIGEETAEYRRGTTNYTDKNKFYQDILLSTQDQYEIESGELTLTIPADSMHTLQAARNKITWTLELRGEIPLWPDVKETFNLVVLPKENTPTAMGE